MERREVIDSVPDAFLLYLSRFAEDRSPINVDKVLVVKEQLYALNAVVLYQAYSTTTGHYTAHVNRHCQWFLTNDSVVSIHVRNSSLLVN